VLLDFTKYNLKIGNTTYNFEDMVVKTKDNWWVMKYSHVDNKLYRIGLNRYIELSPTVLNAYLDYVSEKILLGEEHVN
jgi:hypothetical protein